jgi:hypothetical protein
MQKNVLSFLFYIYWRKIIYSVLYNFKATQLLNVLYRLHMKEASVTFIARTTIPPHPLFHTKCIFAIAQTQ